MQLPQEGTLSFVSSCAIDEFPDLIPHSLLFSRASGFVTLCGLEDRKSGVLPGVTAVGEYQMPDQMIQCTPERMDSLSYQACNGPREFFHGSHAVDPLSSLMVFVRDDFVSVGVKK
jgi:hypothetical protein